MAGKSRLVDQRRLRAKKRRRFFFISLYLFFFVGLIICGLSYLSSLGAFQISDITVVGAERVSSADIESIARTSISGSYMWLFPRGDVFIYPSGEIRNEILALPLVHGVDLTRRGLTTLEIRIEERAETSQWCGTDDGCYSMDEDGFVFGSVASSSAFIYRGLLAGDPLGQHFLSREKFRNIEFFIRELRNISLTPLRATLSPNGYMEVLLVGGGRLLIYIEDDLSSVLATLESVLADKQIASSTEEFLSRLNYLRLDAGNKVTYKEKD